MPCPTVYLNLCLPVQVKSALALALSSEPGPVELDVLLWPRLRPESSLDKHIDRASLGAALAAVLPGTTLSHRALAKQVEKALTLFGRDKQALPLKALLGCVLVSDGDGLQSFQHALLASNISLRHPSLCQPYHAGTRALLRPLSTYQHQPQACYQLQTRRPLLSRAWCAMLRAAAAASASECS